MNFTASELQFMMKAISAQEVLPGNYQEYNDKGTCLLKMVQLMAMQQQAVQKKLEEGEENPEKETEKPKKTPVKRIPRKK